MNNLSAYLDEASDDPVLACKILAGVGINSACLRNVCGLSPQVYKQMADSLKANKISTLFICSDIGLVPVFELSKQTVLLTKALQVAKYFGAKAITLKAGSEATIDAKKRLLILQWLVEAGGMATSYGLIPLLESDNTTWLNSSAEVVLALSKLRYWQVLYDPAPLASKNVDPFIRYWTLVKNRCWAVDLHDYKPGVGSQYSGLGICRLTETVADAETNNLGVRYCAEIGVMPKVGAVANKSDRFKAGITAIKNILDKKTVTKVQGVR